MTAGPSTALGTKGVPSSAQDDGFFLIWLQEHIGCKSTTPKEEG